MCIGHTESQAASLLLAYLKEASFRVYAFSKFISIFSCLVIFTFCLYSCKKRGGGEREIFFMAFLLHLYFLQFVCFHSVLDFVATRGI